MMRERGVDIGSMEVFRHLPEPKEQGLKVLEEAAEFVTALKDNEAFGTDHTRHEMLLEATDVVQALTNALHQQGVTQAEWNVACEECRSRNMARGRL